MKKPSANGSIRRSAGKSLFDIGSGEELDGPDGTRDSMRTLIGVVLCDIVRAKSHRRLQRLLQIFSITDKSV